MPMIITTLYESDIVSNDMCVDFKISKSIKDNVIVGLTRRLNNFSRSSYLCIVLERAVDSTYNIEEYLKLHVMPVVFDELNITFSWSIISSTYKRIYIKISDEISEDVMKYVHKNIDAITYSISSMEITHNIVKFYQKIRGKDELLQIFIRNNAPAIDSIFINSCLYNNSMYICDSDEVIIKLKDSSDVFKKL